MRVTSETFHIEISHPHSFTKQGLIAIKENPWAKDQWPLVYFIDNRITKFGYVGESTNAINRINSHLANTIKTQKLRRIFLITSDRFHKSATLDIEAKLIQYISVEGTYQLLNGNFGLLSHNYYGQEKYAETFRKLWNELIKRKIIHRSLSEIENSQAFKYSPYKSLNEDQYESVLEIMKQLTTRDTNTILIEGGAGTGKTVLATYLIKMLKSDVDSADEIDTDNDTLQEVQLIRSFKQKFPNAKIALVVAMTSLRETLKKVFRQTPGLTGSMVLGPGETFNLGYKYDLLIVDEAHRLRQYRSISHMGSFRKNNGKIGLGNDGTEVDWIIANSKSRIFFYDRNQTVKPSDVDDRRFKQLLESLQTRKLTLKSQMRVLGGVDYIEFVNKLLTDRIKSENVFTSEKYELILFDRITDFKREIKRKERQYKLCRMIAGFSWKWKSQKNKSLIDITIEGINLQWNYVTKDWINSPGSEDQIGCIHTTQGYDLNYAGVIFGNEIYYDNIEKTIKVIPNNYYDKNGKKGLKNDPEKLKMYIINIYRNMMLRGIRGTYVYVCDPSLREYFRKNMRTYKRR